MYRGRQVGDKPPSEGQALSGLLVQKGFALQLLAPQDLRVYTQLTTGAVLQRQSVPYRQSLELLQSRLEAVFDDVALSEQRDLQVRLC
jgi:cleavage and polyadenylation specificity factor subunit 3